MGDRGPGLGKRGWVDVYASNVS